MLVVAAASMFGLVVVLAKLVSATNLSVPMALGLRFGMCAVILAGVVTALQIPVTPSRGERIGVVVLGTVFYAGESSLFFAALHHGEVATVTLLFFTYPIFMLVAASLLSRRTPTISLVASVILAVAGACLVVGTSGSLSVEPIGIALVIGSALGYTGYVLVVHRWLHRTNSVTASMWVTGGVSVVLLLVAAVSGQVAAPLGASTWLQIFGMGGGTAAGIGCLFVGLRRIGPVRTSVLATMEPLAAAALAVTFLGEPLQIGTVLGGSLIVAGSIVAAVSRPQPPAEIP